MTCSNVEIVRRGIEAAIRRPKPDVATMNEVYHPDHEFISALDALEGESRRGAGGYREWRSSVEQTCSLNRRLRALRRSTRRVLAITPTRHQGKASGVTLPEQRFACIVTVRGGKVIRTEVYPSPEEALEAAALPN
jgi:ketosteroid isomerase-like protein